MCTVELKYIYIIICVYVYMLDAVTRLCTCYLYLYISPRLICVANFGCFGWHLLGRPVYLNLLYPIIFYIVSAGFQNVKCKPSLFL